MEKYIISHYKWSKHQIICITLSLAVVVPLILLLIIFALVLGLVVFQAAPNVQVLNSSTSANETTILTTVPTLSSSTSATLSDSFANSMATKTSFPNGSYTLQFSSITVLNSSSLNPLQVNTTVLQNAGITEDVSNSFLVSGRQNFYYVRIPATTSTSSSSRKRRSAEEPLEQTGNQKQAKNGLVEKIGTSNGVSGIGIRYGHSTQLIIVPISLATTSSSNSGVRSITIVADNSTLYEIKASAPSDICNVSALSCTSLDWTPYAILNDNTSAAAGPSKTVYASCGDQCSSGHNSTCSQTCQNCTSQTVSGADTPVSRQYYMGTFKGSFQFQYETYGVMDRITIVYENTLIFDSTCVGTNGLRNVTVAFSGQSYEIRVDVEPNCLGTTGTAWYFITGCPSR